MPSLGLSLPLSPSPCLLPPVGDGPVHSRLALLWNCSVPLFCERQAVYSGRLIFSLSLSLSIPQFKLLSHIRSLRLPSACSGPVHTLSNAIRSSPFCPHLLVADVGIWGTFLLGVAFRHVICGFYLFFLPVRLSSKIQKLPLSASERVSWCLETSSITTPFLGWVSVPSSFVFLFIFYILSYLLLKMMGCFLGT